MTKQADKTRSNFNDVPEYCLSVTAPDGANSVYTLDSPRLVVGRAPDCDIVLDNGAISRHHAEIIRDPYGRWLIHDLGSRNGLKVNGRRVEEQVLSPHTAVRMDKFTLRCTPLSSLGGDAATQGEECRLHDTAEVEISGLGPADEPRLAASHVFALLDIDKQLLETSDADARRMLLSGLLIRSPFEATAVMALRINRETPKAAPRLLCSVAASPKIGSAGLHISRRLLERVSATGQTLMASNTGAMDAQVEMSIEAAVDQMCAVAAPLRGDAKTLDILYIVLPPERGSREWLAMASLVARHYEQAETVLAMRRENQVFELIERDLDRARGIQRLLLPKHIDIAGIDAVFHYEPCRWVGGDYLDAFKLPDGRVFLGVADVCGKGMHAALVSSSLHTMIRSLLLCGRSLLQVMNATSEHMRNFLPPGSYVTMLGIIIDPATGGVEIVNAGHPELRRIGSDGVPVSIKGGENFPLGLTDLAPEEMRSKTISLAPDESLLLYTDGWPDIRGVSGDQLGDQKFLEMIQQAFSRDPDASLRALLGQIITDVDTFRGLAMPCDDRALLIVRWTPRSASN